MVIRERSIACLLRTTRSAMAVVKGDEALIWLYAVASVECESER